MYKKYDSGITIEVNNLSNQHLPDLKFSYSGNPEEIGTIKSLKPGKTAKITGSSKEIDSSDISMYLHYYINNGGKKEDSMIYFSLMQPSKAVVILDIKEVDAHGFLKYKKRGFDGLWKFGPEEIN
ncbi:hypothetical protein [Bacillus sp. Cr_A10]|uniref:hypothetical protein n=1 Tax=Bacillus sp. Cr_A10 TaxID=3033993 RepID=UPI0023DAFB64|nr:hypothetical protein [Bacillus sp. Cr_A10]MDF2066645.1 hypothetical protein [Bacillus sp. Cr_A10]